MSAAAAAAAAAAAMSTGGTTAATIMSTGGTTAATIMPMSVVMQSTTDKPASLVAATAGGGVNVANKPHQAMLGSTEAYFKDGYDILSKENKLLKMRLETVEKENRELKKSLFELTFRFSHAQPGNSSSGSGSNSGNISNSNGSNSGGGNNRVIDLDALLAAKPVNTTDSALESLFEDVPVFGIINSNANTNTNTDIPTTTTTTQMTAMTSQASSPLNAAASSTNANANANNINPQLQFQPTAASSTAATHTATTATTISPPETSSSTSPTTVGVSSVSPIMLASNITAATTTTITPLSSTSSATLSSSMTAMATSSSIIQANQPLATSSSAYIANATSAASTSATIKAAKMSLSMLEASINSSINDNGNLFKSKFDLRGHNGAIYHVLFSNNGKLLSSVSFDKTVRIWDVALQQEVLQLKEHQLHVVDCCWTLDSTELVTCSYDSTAIIWDLSSSKSSCVFKSPAMLQSIIYSNFDPNLLVASTTSRKLLFFDKRKGSKAISIIDLPDNAMASSLVAAPILNNNNNNNNNNNGHNHFLVGTSNGKIHTYDLRDTTTSIIDSINNDNDGKAISHLHFSKPMEKDRDDPLLAVNSYDNVLRVYERGIPLLTNEFSSNNSKNNIINNTTGIGGSGKQNINIAKKPILPNSPGRGGTTTTTTTSSSSSSSSSSTSTNTTRNTTATTAISNLIKNRETELRLKCALVGHMNANWPIKSSFFHGDHRFFDEDGLSTLDNNNNNNNNNNNFDDFRGNSNISTTSTGAISGGSGDRSNNNSNTNCNSTSPTIFLATGSTDNIAYLFEIGIGSSAHLSQQLVGHRDRVYSTAFHPTQPVLATAGGDGVIKIWAPRKRKNVY